MLTYLLQDISRAYARKYLDIAKTMNQQDKLLVCKVIGLVRTLYFKRIYAINLVTGTRKM